MAREVVGGLGSGLAVLAFLAGGASSDEELEEDEVEVSESAPLVGFGFGLTSIFGFLISRRDVSLGLRLSGEAAAATDAGGAVLALDTRGFRSGVGRCSFFTFLSAETEGTAAPAAKVEGVTWRSAAVSVLRSTSPRSTPSGAGQTARMQVMIGWMRGKADDEKR
jgi:hypothetical protein